MSFKSESGGVVDNIYWYPLIDIIPFFFIASDWLKRQWLEALLMLLLCIDKLGGGGGTGILRNRISTTYDTLFFMIYFFVVKLGAGGIL